MGPSCLFFIYFPICVLLTLRFSGLENLFPQLVQLLLPLLLLGLYFLFMFTEPVVHARVRELQIRGPVFLALVEFPEVLLLSLDSDGENMGDIFADDSGSWRALEACRLSLW